MTVNAAAAMYASRQTVAGSRQTGGRRILVDRVSLEFAGARGRAPVAVLNDVSYEVKAGSFTCIIGPSGCGKSTLLSIIAGYLAASRGQILTDDVPVSGPSPERLMVFQNTTLFPWYTAAQNVAFGLSLRANRKPRAEAAAIVKQLIGLVGLGDFSDCYPHELSGGMRQRIEIARALAVNPAVLLMDEPFGALDALTRLTMQQELLRIWTETGKTILLVTHDIGEAVVLADEIVVMTPRPASVAEVVKVDLPRPRSRDNSCFTAVAHHLATLLHAAF
ncbi:MAG TPA: ABC transporter ATP-binding protein [Candidatus Sulfotelmatobacter sp.]|nr:ABC transporter ATP-binding protein [Candidatus Sulfotelmatobacter sp.]